MLACLLTLLFFVPIIFVTNMIDGFFTNDELDEMGICLKHSQP